MPSYLRSDFHTDLATTILNDIQYKRANYYYFLGKVDKWNVDDTIPESTALDSNYENNQIRSNIVLLKRILPNDVTLVTRKYLWASNTIYTGWSDTAYLRNSKFYCVNTENNVYKCLDNNNNSVSQIMPSGKSYEVFKTADAYTWKYMYTIPPFKYSKFASVEYIPVQRSLSDNFYNKGSIEGVTVVNGGSGYTNNSVITISVTGIGSGAVIVPSITSKDIYGPDGTTLIHPKGSITNVTIINQGIGYTVTPVLSVIDPLNTGAGIYGNAHAKLTAVIYNNKIVNVTIEDPGINYTAASSTTIKVIGDGLNAAFKPVIYNGKIIDVITENSGIGYTNIGLQVIGSGTGAILQPNFRLSDFSSEQSIVEQTTVPGGIYSIKITNPGVNYSSNTAAFIEGDGAGCIVNPIIDSSNGSIIKINISNFGSGYTKAKVTLVDIFGSGFTSNVIISPTSGHGKDAVTELFGDILGINTILRFDNILSKLDQDYRQFGILKDPTTISTGEIFRKEMDILAYECTFTDASGIIALLDLGIEDILTIDIAEFKVVSVYNNTVLLQPITINYNITPVGVLISKTNYEMYICTSVNSAPIVDKYSGKLIYVSDELPFTVSSDQGAVIKTYLNF